MRERSSGCSSPVCSMQGMGMSGRGLGAAMWASAIRKRTLRTPYCNRWRSIHCANKPSNTVTSPCPFPSCCPDKWKSGDYRGQQATTPQRADQQSSPILLPGNIPIRMIYGCSGSDMTQRPGGSDLYSQAYQSPNLEFICFQAMEWLGGTQYADIVLPVILCSGKRRHHRLAQLCCLQRARDSKHV